MNRLSFKQQLALILSALCLAAPLAASAAGDATASDQAAHQVATSICSACHGVAGVSKSPLFPNLAGQQESYLLAQLRAFKTKARAEKDAHDYMWGMATLLDDAVIEGLARHYAALKPATGQPGKAGLIARGKRLYEEGDAARGIAACASCHGAGAGGASIFPRLAGQHAPYVRIQLDAIQRQFRASPIMHGVIKDLDADAIASVAEYLQSL